MKKTKSKLTGVVVVFMATLLLAAFVQPSVGAAKKYLIGLDTKIVSNTWEMLFAKSFEWYCEDHGYKWISNEARGDPATQLTQSRQMIAMGVDGLIVCAQDADASSPIVDWASESNIPIFTTDADINHPGVKMYIGYSGYIAGQQLGRKLVEYLKNEVEPIGEVKGLILEMRGPLGGASAIDRSEGFHSVVDKHPNIKVIQALGEFQETPAKKETEALLRRNPHIDAIYSGNGPMCVGAVEAMKDLGMDPTKIFIATIDANPGVLNRIRTGEIDVAVDQPCPFYNPIAVYYLVKYLEEGESALPKVGEVISAEDIDISGKEHLGTNIWAAKEAWSPARIMERAGHLWFQTSALEITRENCDAGYLWANIEVPGW
ncbi:sugar ABC transporter substrate-binding protein [Patescibacteria group bacterium]|nr:sugar ABC transporter substrate-binding protein [Patescibacteria group bacterium]